MDAGDGDINVNDADFLPANPISYDRHESKFDFEYLPNFLKFF